MYPSFIKYKNIEVPDIAYEFWEATLRYEKETTDRNKYIFKPSDDGIYETDITGERTSGDEAKEHLSELADQFVKSIFLDWSGINGLVYMPQSGYMTVGSSVTEHVDNLMFAKDPLIVSLTDMHIEVNRTLYPIQKGDVWSIPTNIPHAVPAYPTDMKWAGVRMSLDPYRCSIEHLSNMFEYEQIEYVDLTQIKGGLKRAWGDEEVKGGTQTNLMAKSPFNIDVNKLKK